MKLIRPFRWMAAIAAMAIAAPGVSFAQDKPEEEKKVPAAKVKAKEAEEEDDDKVAAPKLDVGSKAPALELSDWVKGDKVEKFKDGQVYVVEFWATWCGPCKMSMPHIAEVQTKYGDKVKVIGISDEDTPTVEKFLKKEQSPDKTWDEVITYALAMDDERKTTESYRIAAGEGGIPCSFIVGKEGVIEWIGHPMGMDKALEEVVSGKYDRSAAIAERADARALQVVMRKVGAAMQKGDSEAALKLIDGAMAKKPGQVQLAFVKLQILEAGDDEKAAKAFVGEVVKQLDAAIAKEPESANLYLTKLQLLGKGEDKAAADKFAEEVITKIWDDSQMLNQVSWYIAAEKQLPGTLETAMKAAKRAVELTKEKDGTILDTLARVYFEQGKIDEAIEWQKKAVELSKDPQLTEALEKYEKAKEKAKKDSQ